MSTRIPLPTDDAESRGISVQTWNALVSNIFPNATSASGILDAWDTAVAKGLDVMKGHMAIVGQRRQVNGEWTTVEAAWPTLKSLVYTAHKTGAFAGLDPIQFGPNIERLFKGSIRVNGRNESKEVPMVFPEFATCTVYRIVGNAPRPFTETVFFEELASMTNGLPTLVWYNKPRLMLAKCAKAAALRIAFAECEFSADEMQDQVVGSADLLPFPADNQPPILAEQSSALPADTVQSTSQASGFDEPTFGSSAMGDAATTWDDVSVRGLKWLSRAAETARATTGYEPAIANMRSSLDPGFQPLGEALIRAWETIQLCPKGEKVADYLDKACAHGGDAFDRAIAGCHKQAETGAITASVAKACETVLTFQKALRIALVSSAA